MTNAHEEWLVQVKQRYWEEHGGDKWRNAMMWYGDGNRRYAKTAEEAKQVLDHAYVLFNGEKIYDADGKRYDTHPAGMLSVAVESTRESDKDLEIVASRVMKRIVTDWEEIKKAE